MTSFPKPQKWRSRDYLDWLKDQTCYLCQKKKADDPHHERRFADAGTAQTPSDLYALPVCRECHDKAQEYKDVDVFNAYIQMIRHLKLWMLERGIK